MVDGGRRADAATGQRSAPMAPGRRGASRGTREAADRVGVRFADRRRDGVHGDALRGPGNRRGGLGISVVLGAQGLGLAGMVLLGGVVGDRFPRRSVMVFADGLRLVSQGVVAVLLIVGEASVWQLVVAQLVHGIGTGLFMPASVAIVPDAVAGELVQATNALKQVARAIASALGPALGAGACAVVGPGLALGADAVTFGASALLLSGIPARRRKPSGKGWLDELREGWAAFRLRRWMQSVTVQFTVVNALVLAPFFVFGPIRAEETLGGVAGWGLLLTALAVGEVVGGFVAARWRPERPLVAGTAVFGVWVLPLILLAALAPLPLVALALIGAGFGQAVFAVLWETTVQSQVGEAERSRLSSFEMFGSLAFVPFGFVVGGIVEQTMGAGVGLIGGAILLGASATLVVALPSVRSLKAVDFD